MAPHNSDETRATLPELRVDAERNPHCHPTEFLHFRNYVENLYAEHYKITQTQHKPHLIFVQSHRNIYEMQQMFSGKINKPGNSKAVLVSWTTEPIQPYGITDHSVSYHTNSASNTWLPHLVYMFREEFVAMLNGKPTQRMLTSRQTPKPNFCAFIYTKEKTEMFPHIQNRLDFCAELMKYKKVLCPGKSMNNVQPPDYLFADTYGGDDFTQGLVRYLAECKFYIAFDNSTSSKSDPGNLRYFSEKIMAAFTAGAIPIYSGHKDIAEFFNPAAFINSHDFSSHQELVEYVKKVDNSPELTAAYQNAPPILPDSPLHKLHPDKIRPLFLSFAERALKQSSKPFILQPKLVLRKMGTVPKSNPIGLARVSYRYAAQKVKELKK